MDEEEPSRRPRGPNFQGKQKARWASGNIIRARRANSQSSIAREAGVGTLWDASGGPPDSAQVG
jgi:hypothetical protein